MQPQHIITYTFQQIDLLILCRGQEVRTFKRTNRSIDLFRKEIGDATGRTFPDKHTDHPVAFVLQHLTEGQSLCQMPSALPLYDKQHFHTTSAYNKSLFVRIVVCLIVSNNIPLTLFILHQGSHTFHPIAGVQVME